MTPGELVLCALAVADEPNRRLGASRTIAVALLLRQALEDALDEFWRSRAPGLERCSGRAQFISLPFFLEPPGMAGNLAYCWNRLSDACHHDSYEMPPTVAEVSHFGRIIEDFTALERPGR